MGREVVQTQQDERPPAKRTWSAGQDSDIIMTLPNLLKIADKIKTLINLSPTQPAPGQEAGISHSTASLAHSSAGVQHASNNAPIPGQHQLPLQQSSLLWWA